MAKSSRDAYWRVSYFRLELQSYDEGKNYVDYSLSCNSYNNSSIILGYVNEYRILIDFVMNLGTQ